MLRFLIGKKQNQIQSIYIKIVQSKNVLQHEDNSEKIAEREKELQVLTGAIGQFEVELSGYQ